MVNKNYSLNFFKILRRLRLKNMPIVYGFALIVGLIFIVISVLSWILIASYKSDKEKSTLAVIDQMNNQTINKIDEYVGDIINLTKIPLFAYNYGVDDTQDDFVNELQLFSKTNTSSLKFQNLVGQVSYMIFNSRSHVNSVFVFNREGKSEYRQYSKVFEPGSLDLNNETWFENCINGLGKPIIISTYSIPGCADENNKPYYIFSIARGIMDFPEAKAQGSILINCNIGIFRDFCNKMLIVPGQRVTIVNKSGNIVYDTSETNITRKLDPQFLDLICCKPSGEQNINVNGKSYLVNYKTSEITGWKVVNILPKNELFRSINATRNFIALICSILIIISLLLILLLSKQIVSPLSKLVYLMRLVEKGDFEVKIKINNRNEIGQLAKTFNSMARRIKKLINEVYVDKIRQKELELQMLQNQINPHFLYNTLEAIHMVAEINNDNEASQMSRSLGRILRYGISKGKEVVTVKNEIDNLNDYIFLQKVRFARFYDIIVDVNENILENRVIKLILQPLVENAIYHGLSGRSKYGKIKVLGYRENDRIIFEVIDNGSGMDEKQVKIINNYINDLDNSLNSIGIKNVHKRIQLYYGSDYGIEIKSTLGVGTSVKVIVPADK